MSSWWLLAMEWPSRERQIRGQAGDDVGVFRRDLVPLGRILREVEQAHRWRAVFFLERSRSRFFGWMGVAALGSPRAGCGRHPSDELLQDDRPVGGESIAGRAADPVLSGHLRRPASSTIVGIRSTVCAAVSMRVPAGMRPGAQTIHGIRTTSSHRTLL